MMAPPVDYRLTTFLVRLATEMTNDDLVKMKFFLTGCGGIGRRVLESLTNPIEFFDRLRTGGFLSINNIVVLQSLVWHTGREDLYEQTVRFAEQLEDVVYTCDPSPVAENGFGYTRFHLKGPLKKENIEELRALVAGWMGVPQHTVVVAGVQPSESWVITLMVPSISAMDLSKAIWRHREWLVHRGIDWFAIDERVTSLSDGVTDSPMDCDHLLVTENARLTKMNADLEDVTENLWTHIRIQENVIAELKSSVEKLHTSVVEKRADRGPYFFGLFLWTLCYLNLFKKTFMDGTCVGVRLKNGAAEAVDRLISEFSKCMEAVRKKDCDGELIDRLLDSFRRIVRVEQLEEIRLSAFLVQQQNFQVFVQNYRLEQENMRLKLELTRHLIKRNESDKTPGNGFVSGSGRPGPQINIQAEISVVMGTPHFHSALEDVSVEMKPKDKDKVLKAVQQDILIDRLEIPSIKKEESRFLYILFIKKYQDVVKKSAEFHQNPEIYIQSLLNKARRHDLSEKLAEKLAKARIEALSPPVLFFNPTMAQVGGGQLPPKGVY